MNEYVFMALRNLKARKLRNYLTALGIIIGVTALVSLITLGEGLEKGIGDNKHRLESPALKLALPKKEAPVIFISKDEKYNKMNAPDIRLFNEYFGCSFYWFQCC